jgi:hypothetical protein
MKHYFFAAFALLLFTQCQKNEPEIVVCFGEMMPFALDEPFTLAPDIFYQENNSVTPLTLRLDRIVSDSRCPSDADCVWEGRVEVALNLQQDGKFRHDTLSLPGLIDPDFPVRDTAFFQGYKIILLAVNPYPNSANAGNIPQSDYRLEMLVSKN